MKTGRSVLLEFTSKVALVLVVAIGVYGLAILHLGLAILAIGLLAIACSIWTLSQLPEFIRQLRTPL